MKQHQKQLTRALEKNPDSFLSKIDSQQCYFETSSKSGEGVEDLFRYIEKTILAQKQRQGASSVDGATKKGGKGGKSSDGSFQLSGDDAISQPERPRQCCGGQ